MRPHQNSRIDLGELKAQIVKNLGPDRSKWYFYYLNRLLSQKLSKNEFDKLSIRVLGRENLHLHNQFIWSILKNACQAKTPPPNHVSSLPKSSVQASNSSPCREDQHEQSGPIFPNQNQNIIIWSNGVLPVSPRKGRSGIRDRKLKDRPSPLGPNGKVECVSHQMTGTEGNSRIITDNGDTNFCDYQRPVQHLQSVAVLPENAMEGAIHRPTEKLRIQSKIHTEAARFEDQEEVGQTDRLGCFRSHLSAPLGIPFCSASVGAPRKAMQMGSGGDFVSYYDSGGLSDTDTLRKRMEQIAAAQGIEGVSMECANMLNNTLDVYLKKLIRSCVELVGVRSSYEPKKHSVLEQQVQNKVMNGMWPNNHSHVQNSIGPADIIQKQRPQRAISLLDFNVAMELNPQQLGEDWPLMLEKIRMHSFDE